MAARAAATDVTEAAVLTGEKATVRAAEAAAEAATHRIPQTRTAVAAERVATGGKRSVGKRASQARPAAPDTAAQPPVTTTTTAPGPSASAEMVRVVEPAGASAGVRPAVRENVVRSNENPYTFTSETFQTSTEWTAPTGTRQTYTVHQRADIDWSTIRTSGDKNFIGRTNLEAAKAGFAPQLSDGSLATLHHINQNGRGSLVEASRKHHGTFGTDGQRILHGSWGRTRGHPENPINRVQFEQDTAEYWKWRVSE